MSKNNLRICLMSCCAPCSAGAILQLKEQGADFCVLFYNPNIFPESEYQRRLTEQIRLCESLCVRYAVGDWAHDEWLSCIRGKEAGPERGQRCTECFKHRFAFGAKWAKQNGYDAIASVFGLSRHKDQSQVDDAAKNITGSIRYIPINWDKQIGQKMIEKAGFYRQNYCGCEFSVKTTGNT